MQVATVLLAILIWSNVWVLQWFRPPV